MRLTTTAGLTLIALTAAACGGDGSSTGPTDSASQFGITATGPGVLSVSPLDTSTLFAATPLGMMAPPGHVLPTDHIYLLFVDPWSGQQQLNDCSKRPVRAAGAGVVTFTLVTEPTGGDTKVDIQMTKTFHYYYDHVLLKPGIGVGSHVAAGDTIGTTTGRCPSMDLGVYDYDVTPTGFVNLARYAGSTLHVVSPYKYFSEPLRSWLYARVRLFEGVPTNKDGRTDWGVRGHLSGDWFHASLANDSATVINGPAGWPKSISFAYDWFAAAPRISIGGTIAAAGVLSVRATDPEFAAVSVGSGVVAYKGTPTLGVIPAGWLLVQMTADDRIRVEYFAGATSQPSGFTSAAQDYVR